MNVQMRQRAVPDVARFGDHVALLHLLPDANAAAVLADVQILRIRSVGMKDDDTVIREVPAVAIVMIDDLSNLSTPGRANLGADRHDEVVREFLPVAMADDGAIALTTKP